VVATVAGAFASDVLADAGCVAHRPRGLTDAQAAALPLVTMTARYALQDLAGLRPGQTILIHSAAGGVGLAAIQIAQRLGATIFATAGSEDKRAYLRSLGITQVFSSRSAEFAKQIAAITAGKGVDVVLNALSEPYITASVNTLAVEGTFLEIGKRDIWSPEQFRAARPHGRYHAIDLSVMRVEDPSRWSEMFHALMDDVASGRCRPLPVRTFPLTEAASAFSYMAQARHIGKIVLTHATSGGRGLNDLDPDGIYLVTGGLAGLGLKTAQHLVQQGARALALVGRNPPGPDAQVLIGLWRAAGLEVLELQADIGIRNEVAASFAKIDATGRPLRGVVHSAGALADGALLHQEWNHFSTPFRAKVAGAWALHQLTRDRTLDFFILYSSVAATFGSAGQANHAAANAFLDALASYRRAIGLPALSIGWGAWSGIGAAAERGVDEAVAARGIGSISPGKGMDLLDTLAARAPAHIVVSPMNWPKYLATFTNGDPTFLKDFEADAKSVNSVIESGRRELSAAPILSELEAAAPAARRGLLLEFVRQKVAFVLGRQGDDVLDPRRPLNEMGLDSLLAVELRNRLGADLGLPRGLPATLVFDHPTIEELTAHLEHRLAPTAPEEPVSAPSDLLSSLASIDSMTEDEIEAHFARISRN
jgi:NADPH:quinone reductase-like Zn-dependent oxidoreductase